MIYMTALGHYLCEIVLCAILCMLNKEVIMK